MANTITYSFIQRELNLLENADDISMQAWGFGVTAAAFLMRRMYRDSYKHPKMLTLPKDCLTNDFLKSMNEIMHQVMQIFGSLGVQNDYLQGRVEELLGELMSQTHNDSTSSGPTATEALTQLYIVANNLLKRLEKANGVLQQQSTLVAAFVELISYDGCDCEHDTPKNLLHRKMLEHLEAMLHRQIDEQHLPRAEIEDRVVVLCNHEEDLQKAKIDLDEIKSQLSSARHELSEIVTQRNQFEVAFNQTELQLQKIEGNLEESVRSRNSQQEWIESQSGFIIRLAALIEYKYPQTGNDICHMNILNDEMIAHLQQKLTKMQEQVCALNSDVLSQTAAIKSLSTVNSLQSDEILNISDKFQSVNTLLCNQSALVVELAQLVGYDVLREYEMLAHCLLSKEIVDHVHGQLTELRSNNKETKLKLQLRTSELEKLQIENDVQRDEFMKQEQLLKGAEEIIALQSCYVDKMAHIIGYQLPTEVDQIDKLLLHDEMLDHLRFRLDDLNSQLHRLNEDLVSMLILRERNETLESEKMELMDNLLCANRTICDQSHFIEGVAELTKHAGDYSDISLSMLLKHLKHLMEEMANANVQAERQLQLKIKEIESLNNQLIAQDFLMAQQSAEIDHKNQLLAAEHEMVSSLSHIVDYNVDTQTSGLLTSNLLVHIENEFRMLKKVASTGGDMQSLFANSQQENVVLKNQLIQKNQNNVDLQTEVEKRLGQLCQQSSLIETLQSELAEKSELIEDFRFQNKVLVDENDALQRDLVEKNKAIANLEESLNKLENLRMEQMRDQSNRANEFSQLEAKVQVLQDQLDKNLLSQQQFARDQSNLVDELCGIIDFKTNNLFDDLESEANVDYCRALSAEMVQHVRNILQILPVGRIQERCDGVAEEKNSSLEPENKSVLQSEIGSAEQTLSVSPPTTLAFTSSTVSELSTNSGDNSEEEFTMEPTDQISEGTSREVGADGSSESDGNQKPATPTTDNTSSESLTPRLKSKRREQKPSPRIMEPPTTKPHSHNHNHPPPQLYSSLNRHVGVPLYRAPIKRSSTRAQVSPAHNHNPSSPRNQTDRKSIQKQISKSASSDVELKPSPAGVAELRSPAARLSSEDYCKNFSSTPQTIVADNEDDFFRFMSFQTEMPSF